MKVQFHLSGLVGIDKHADVPGLRINVRDAVEACYLHDLSMSTESDIKKVATGTATEGLAHELQTGRPGSIQVEKIAALRSQVQKSVLYTVPPEYLITKFDTADVRFTGEFREEDVVLAVLDSALALEKAEFEFSLRASSLVVDLLHKAEQDGLTSRLRVRTEKGSALFTIGTGEGTLIKDATFNIPPRQKEVTKVNVRKFTLAPFDTFQDVYLAMNTALMEVMEAGVFGYEEYQGDDGEIIEEAPGWCVETMSEDWIIVCVYGRNKTEFFMVPYTVSEEKTITFGSPVSVQPVQVWLQEGEDVKIVPAGGAADEAEEEMEEEPAEGAPVAAAAVSSTEEERSPLRKVALVHKADGDSRYVLGVVLEPNDGKDAPLNPDTQGDVYSAADIAKAAHAWLSEFQNTGVMHKELAGRRIVPVESYIAPADFEIGEQKILKGTWMLGAVVQDDALWAQVKSGAMTGWSMGGMASREAL
jgi:hypothetical protein